MKDLILKIQCDLAPTKLSFLCEEGDFESTD